MARLLSCRAARGDQSGRAATASSTPFRITRDTVEEKILELQDRKKQLSEDVVAADESFVKKLTIEDVEAFFGAER